MYGYIYAVVGIIVLFLLLFGAYYFAFLLNPGQDDNPVRFTFIPVKSDVSTLIGQTVYIKKNAANTSKESFLLASDCLVPENSINLNLVQDNFDVYNDPSNNDAKWTIRSREPVGSIVFESVGKPGMFLSIIRYDGMITGLRPENLSGNYLNSNSDITFYLIQRSIGTSDYAIINRKEQNIILTSNSSKGDCSGNLSLETGLFKIVGSERPGEYFHQFMIV